MVVIALSDLIIRMFIKKYLLICSVLFTVRFICLLTVNIFVKIMNL